MKHKIHTLKPIHASPAIRSAYRKQIEGAIRAMHARLFHKLQAEYETLESRIVRDAKWRSPNERFEDLLQEEREVWTPYFERLADKACDRFTKSIYKQVKHSRKQSLQDMFGASFDIKINPSRYTNDTFQAITSENVGLIRSIPEQYFGRIEHDVFDCIANGLDRGELTRRLRADFGKSQRRAEIISRDQTAKATEAMSRATDADLGITEGIWMHVPGRKESRPSHVKMNGKRFVIEEGLYDSAVGRKVKCAELPMCQCTYMPVVPENWMA